ncbi:glycosyltransferase [Pelagicoccus albus]|uniref:Glycosyltransferase n=1 Tax=Pelagicoccus albus TaxID=415222 RepID=A0A7X1E6T2_9BACT|nr:glycosyltransferase [Pelagicoccus albus]MBC2604609.1 glycosyltransferase [Pelagicoccus albus]
MTAEDTVSPLRVVILQDYLRNGGTEQQTLAIAEEIAKLGAETHIIVFRRGGVLDERAASLPITLHFLNQGPLKTDWYAPGLRAKLKSIAPHAVLPMGRMANCLTSLLPSKAPYSLFSTFRTGRSIPFLYRRALKRADHIIANSQEALKRLADQYGIKRANNSTVIYNGCIRDFETVIPSFHPDGKGSGAKRIRFCSVSMFRPQKQQIRLIQICSRLPKEIDWELALAGEGPTRVACEEEARRLGVSDRVRFLGLLKDPRSLYFDSDIAVHTSDLESLPNFLVEAQMAGLPVVAYDVNGVGETFLDQKSGFLIPHGNEFEFQKALEKLAQNLDLRLQMSEQARYYAQDNFSLKSQSDAYFRLFQTSIDKD